MKEKLYGNNTRSDARATTDQQAKAFAGQVHIQGLSRPLSLL